jgi:hypothetical protein
LAKEHALPQPLQFATLVLRFVSQPSETCALQSPNPAVHAIEQAPAVQVGFPFVVEQAAPHAPQFGALVCVFVSQPLPGRPSQSPRPALHDTS